MTKKVYPHLIRHTIATMGLRHGMDVTEIQKMLGHADIETTLKTYYPEPENKRVRLHPENASMDDIIVRACNIQGVAKHVIKKL